MEGAAWLSGTSWELGCRLHAADEFRPWGLCQDFCDQSLINTRKEEKTRTVDCRHSGTAPNQMTCSAYLQPRHPGDNVLVMSAGTTDNWTRYLSM